MNTKQIECFLAAAECQNLREAGDRVFASASTISRQIAALEEEIGAQLFLRNAAKWQLTASGQIIYHSFAAMLRQQQQDFAKARQVSQTKENTIRIAFFQYASPEAFFLDEIRMFKQRYPDIQTVLHCCEVCMQEKFLREDHCDVVFAFDWQIPKSTAYESVRICGQKIGLFVSKSITTEHPGFQPHMLQNPTVWYIEGYDRQHNERQTYEVMQHFHVENWHIRTAPNWDTAWMNVAAGEGVIVSDRLVSAWRPQCYDAFYLPDDLLPGDVRAYWKKNNQNPIVNLFINTISGMKPNE